MLPTTLAAVKKSMSKSSKMQITSAAPVLPSARRYRYLKNRQLKGKSGVGRRLKKRGHRITLTTAAASPCERAT